VQRTAEAKCCKFQRFVHSSASRTPNGPTLLPALKRWAIVIQSASGTKKNTFAAKLRGVVVATGCVLAVARFAFVAPRWIALAAFCSISSTI